MDVRLGWSRVEWSKDAGPKAWQRHVEVRGHSSAKAIGRIQACRHFVRGSKSPTGLRRPTVGLRG
jgi:hypothetical protein